MYNAAGEARNQPAGQKRQSGDRAGVEEAVVLIHHLAVEAVGVFPFQAVEKWAEASAAA
jgi:hypothetical protein